jgi:hypothetical protein
VEQGKNMNEKKEQPNYYAILTADIRYSKELNFFEKVLYADITALTNKNGYCTASNGYFAEVFDKAKETISRAISKFEKLGFLRVIITRDNQTKQIINRKLYLLTKISIPLDENVNRGIDENVKENTTSNNNININIKNKQKENKTEIFPDELNIEAFDMWIEYKGKSYKPQGRTLSINKLIKYPKDVQLQMVENSIMNNYKGLFEVKSSNTQVSTQANAQQNKKLVAEVLVGYIQNREKGFTRSVATLQAKEKLNWGLYKDLDKVIQDKEYEWYKLEEEYKKQQNQNKMSWDEKVKKMAEELL